MNRNTLADLAAQVGVDAFQHRIVRKNTVLLGIDPGLAHLGYAAIELPPDPAIDMMRITDFGLLKNKKSDKKQHVLATEDNLRRARILAEFLEALIERHTSGKSRLIAICAESMSWPRNAAASSKIGIAWGVLAATALRHHVPILQAAPMVVKLAVAGSKTASKEDVQAGVERIITRVHPDLGGTLPELGKRIPKGDREHPYDAAAVAITCRKAEAVQLARRGNAP